MIKFQTIIFNTILLLMLLLKVQNKNAGFYTILFWILQTENSEKKATFIINVIKLSTDDRWQSLQKTLKPGM